jgi:hypothetical protein
MALAVQQKCRVLNVNKIYRKAKRVCESLYGPTSKMDRKRNCSSKFKAGVQYRMPAPYPENENNRFLRNVVLYYTRPRCCGHQCTMFFP